jgi:hypothetical protein
MARASFPAEPVMSIRVVCDTAWLASTLPSLLRRTYICVPLLLTTLSVASSGVEAAE